ncbi:MAG: ComEA family DNA-binding protein [Anaerolineaceae bacterium]|nr:ComEA family DNA-binding protein [Anaerolineaceae bacterium]
MQTRYRGILFFGIAALVLAGVLIFQARRLPSAPLVLSTATAPPSPAPTATPPPMQVYVTGAVSRPDVYPLPQGSIVKDAILAAGGPAPDADLERINLAASLSAGQQVHVPRQGEAAPPSLPARSETIGDGRINVNTAGAALLETLPGIGPSLAQRILEHRESNGPFESVQDLLAVPGIGPATLAKFEEMITTD